ncbi:MAG TPA: serine hydrolase [Symbiobacteriaceae bacterium]
MAKLKFSGPWVEHLLYQHLGNQAGQVGVMVEDLATGATAAVSPDRQFPAASVAKVPIAMCLLHYVTTGSISLTDRVTYQSVTDYEEGSGTLRYAIKNEDSFTVDFLLDRMIVVSDNIARNMLERHLGSETVASYMLNLGVLPPYYAPWPMMTDRGATIFLDRLDAFTAGISHDLTQLLIHLMASTVYNDRIPALLPPDVTAAHKVGTLANNVHDVGIIYAPDRSFIISAFTEDIPYDDACRLIADLTATVYWYEDWLVTAGG